jgi:hypothetical protein
MAYDIADRSRTTMTELELLARFQQAMRDAEECSRGLAHSRMDLRWLKVADLIDNVRAKAAMVANARQRAN